MHVLRRHIHVQRARSSTSLQAQDTAGQSGELKLLRLSRGAVVGGGMRRLPLLGGWCGRR